MIAQHGVLIIDDSEDDALLLEQEVITSGYCPNCEQVYTPIAMRSRLDAKAWYVNALEELEAQNKELSRIQQELLIHQNELEMQNKELHAVQHELEVSRNRYLSIIEDQTELICRYLPTGRLTFVNGEYARYYGMSQEKLINSDFVPNIPEPDLSKIMGLLSEITSENPLVDYTHRIITPAGELHWQRWTQRGIFSSEGVLLEYQAVGRDISGQKVIEEKLLLAKSAAEEANITKGAFLACMSHEIRTPMNVVIGFTGVLLETELDNEQREYAELVRQSGENMIVLINDILDFSKIEAGKLDIDIVDFDLRATLNDTACLLAKRAADAGLELICHINPDMPSNLKGDPGRLGQIITNLVGNAIKFTPTGKVVISAEIETDRCEAAVIRFSVQDTGIGIPENRRAAIFDPFTQAESSTTRNYGGTGLGLAICKQLAELMGGKIGVESCEGKGSTFWFTSRFEKQNAEAVSSTASRVKTSEVSSGIFTRHTGIKEQNCEVRPEARILLVEDDIINQKVAQALLNRLGYKADVVANGQEAVNALESTNYDVVLMDCLMPEMNGFDATSLIRSPCSKVLNHEVTIVAMTANAMKEDREQCLEAGMNDYLAKPVKKDEMAKVLLKWLSPREVSGYIRPPELSANASRGIIESQLINREHDKAGMLPISKLISEQSCFLY